MKNFIKISENTDVSMLLHALAHHGDLWNKNKFRTTFENTPHVDVDDIWLRYANVIEDTTTTNVKSDLGSIWYSPICFLPQVKPIVLNLMHKVEAYSLERLIVTKIKPGGIILPHADNEGEYVHAGDIARYHIVLNGKEGSLFRCGDETVCMKTGEIWWFNALIEHEVKNNSDEDRIHLLADLRFMP